MQLFAGQEKIPFHHLPEYVNRFLVPPHPSALDYVVRFVLAFAFLLKDRSGPDFLLTLVGSVSQDGRSGGRDPARGF